MPTFLRYAVPLACVCFVLAPSLSEAQQETHPRAEVHISVRDPSGAGLAADGELSGPLRRRVRSDGSGALDVIGLLPGRYRLLLRHPGFESRMLSLTVLETAPLQLTVTLAVSGVASSVTVADTPIGRADTPPTLLPVPVQAVTAADLQTAVDPTDALNKNVNGVYLNSNAGNPFEADVNYRGYTASPLLGTPQGLSVYLDGVRQNQPFGDIVAWDLIPKQAIEEITLIPGSDPLYGLNTLGGALALRTKDGATNPGASVEGTGGAFGRAALNAEYGGARAASGLDWYAAGSWYREDGWRQLSPSSLRQGFGKLRWTRGRTAASLSVGLAENTLTGNGLQDFRALARSYASVYSVPDRTRDHAPSLTFEGTHDLGPIWSLAADAYARHVRSDTVNGNINTDSFSSDLRTLSAADRAALAAAGYTEVDPDAQPFPSYLCIAQALEKADPLAACTGLTTVTRTQQNNYGAGGLTSARTRRSRFAAGAAWDRSSLSYTQDSQFGYLGADGVSILPVPAFADGSTSDGGTPVDGRAALHGTVQTGSVYATETLLLGPWALTASGRWNRTGLNNLDRLPPSAVRGSLTASDTFERFNPAVGAVYRARGPFAIYAQYSEASRAPTSIELGCADPHFPCNLPNALAGDPPLRQVVARTVEAGVRGNGDGPLRWTADWFRTENAQDLLFVSSPQLGFGYFLNFGRTRREGVELDISARGRVFTASGGYTFLQATYQSPQALDGSSNSSSADDGTIAIVSGNRIPQAPRQLFKGRVEWRPTSKWSADLNMLAVGPSYARGNENNRDKPDGVYYLGSGGAAGYGVVNAGAQYRINGRFTLFAQCDNLLDRHYSTGAQLGPVPFDNAGRFIPPPPAPDGSALLRSTTFQAPGTPLNLFGGLRVRLP